MKEKFKNVFNKDVWNPIIVGLAVLAIIDWIIYPSLTAPNTIFNIFGLIVSIGTAIFVVSYIKDTWFTTPEEIKSMEAEWKEEVLKKMEKVQESFETKSESVDMKTTPDDVDKILKQKSKPKKK